VSEVSWDPSKKTEETSIINENGIANAVNTGSLKVSQIKGLAGRNTHRRTPEEAKKKGKRDYSNH